MKATQEQYEQAIKVYDKSGVSGVHKYAQEIGVDSYSYCRDCEEHTPDCHDDCCLVCGTHKPSARQIVLTLHDSFAELVAPLEERESDRYREFPAFTGGDDWHKVTSMLDLNVWEDEFEVKAAIYLVSDGKALTTRDCFIPVKVHDLRTKLELESVEQTIERLMDTIEQLRKYAQRIIDLTNNHEYADSLQRSLDAIIDKHQQSY
jgi:hypothetical protein